MYVKAVPHRLPETTNATDNKKRSWNNRRQKGVNTCLETTWHGSNWSVASCSQTGIYSLRLRSDFCSVCCSVSRWLYLGNRSVYKLVHKMLAQAMIRRYLILISLWWHGQGVEIDCIIFWSFSFYTTLFAYWKCLSVCSVIVLLFTRVAKTDSIQSQLSSKTSRGKKTTQKDTIKDITSDNQVNSNFPYWLSYKLDKTCCQFASLLINPLSASGPLLGHYMLPLSASGPLLGNCLFVIRKMHLQQNYAPTYYKNVK